MATTRASSILAFTLGLASAAGQQVRLEEVWVSRYGELLDFVVSVHEFALVIDRRGMIAGVELLGGVDTSVGFDFEYRLLARHGVRTRECRYTGSRIDRIGDTWIRYGPAAPFDTQRVVEEIGDLKIVSETPYRMYRITRIGCVRIDYDEFSQRIRRVGGTKLVYHSVRNTVIGMHPVADTCSVPVRLYLPADSLQYFIGLPPDTGAATRRLLTPFRRELQ